MALLKQHCSDFFVSEQLGWSLSGEGEHHFYFIERQNLTSEQMARQLAKALKVRPRDVAFSGRKDKVALTQQWFSVQRPGQALIAQPELASGQVLTAQLHHRKLKTGSHHSNQFRIRLRGELDEGWQTRWQQVCERGASNAFGAQRFGFDNLAKASRWFAGEYRPKRHERGLLLSAVRSQLFNEYLALRGDTSVQVGDVCLLGTSQSGFVVSEETLADARQRYDQGDIHISGPLFGIAPGLQCTGQPLAWEQTIAERHPKWLAGLAAQEVKQARRALRVCLTHSQVDEQAEFAEFSFELPKGAFATSVLAQITEYTDVSRAQYSANQ